MLESSPEISIIIPIYNTPGTILDECLSCLTQQNYENYEILCIDDCSSRIDTLEMEEQYAKDFPKAVNLFRFEKNRGAAEARNFGLNRAKGAYCIFLDSDDVFSIDFILKLYNKIIEYDSDLCICECSLFATNGEQKKIIDRVKINFEFKDIEGRENMLTEIPASGCNRLCKTSFLKKNNIYFQNLKSDNDMYFALKSVLCTNKICILHDCELMLYRFNTEFQISANMNPLNMMSAINKLLSEVRDISLYDNAYSMIACYSIFTGVFELCNCKAEKNARIFYNCFRKSFIEVFPVLENERCNLYIDYWRNNDFESRWFDNIGNYLKQLRVNSTLSDRLKAFRLPIYVWGRGRRGDAFELWCEEKNIHVEGICDRKNCDVGQKDKFNIQIISTECIGLSKGIIVATNHDIYNFLTGVTNAPYVLDLEDFCPL